MRRPRIDHIKVIFKNSHFEGSDLGFQIILRVRT